MDSNPSKKCMRNYQRKKCLQTENIDRISDLHDSVLGKILSYLPTRDAVAASILSTRWRHLFPSEVPIIRLDLDVSHISPNLSYNFMDFVDKLFNVDLCDVTRVDRVVINCRIYYEEDKILSWVCAALRLNVKCLRLVYYSGDWKALLDILNGCTTLQELELGGDDFELFLPEEFMLPNLKRLVLNSVSLLVLLNGCTVLTDLRINVFYLGVLDTLYIQHPFIKKLSIDGSSGEDINKIVIDAPNLEAFEFKGHFVAEYVFVNIKSLHSVCIYLSGDHGRYSSSRNLAKLVHACSSTTRLHLPGNSVDEMCIFSCVSLPTFPNLTCLTLGRMGSHGWSVLAQFLKNAPNLTTLTFEEELDFVYYPALAKFPLPSMPSFEMRVKKIEIWEFKWIPIEIELIEYFLKNGRLLEELIVHCLPCKNQSDSEKLSMFPRYSKACQVLLKDKISRAEPCYSR